MAEEYTLSADAARRVSDAVRTVEGEAKGPSVKRGNGPRILATFRRALTSSTITAASGTQKGTGTVTLYCDKGDGSGIDVVLETGVKVWNPYTASIASGKWGVVGTIDGLLQFFGSDC